MMIEKGGQPEIHSKLEHIYMKSALGTTEIIKASPENRTEMLPVVFQGGYLQGGTTTRPYLEYFAGIGREAFTLGHLGPAKVGISKVELETQAGEVTTIQHQINKAQTLLDAIEMMAYDKVDAVFQSESAIHGLIAAYMQPERFKSIAFAYPAGLTGKRKAGQISHSFAKQI